VCDWLGIAFKLEAQQKLEGLEAVSAFINGALSKTKELPWNGTKNGSPKGRGA
jgi:hypothetical protein